jgi:hypothetical protein
MAGKSFLNPILKIVLCSIGVLVMGYFVYGSVQAGEISERITIIRALVLVGFAYLLVQSVKELVIQRER